MAQTVWQLGCGDAGRDYSRLLLKHDLACLGPGRYGPYDAERYGSIASSGEFTGRKMGGVEDFCIETRAGDIVVLRRGARIVAIGMLTDAGYQHDESFDDVYGWDLEHTLRVIWQDHLTAEIKAHQPDHSTCFFGNQTLKQSFSRVHDRNILDRIRDFVARCEVRPLKPLPQPPPAPLSLEELGQALFARGLANSAIDHVQRTIERQRRLLGWYREYGKASARPDEHEVVAHVILPLLLALGWSEQLLAVEWHKVDLAGFWGTPTTPENCVLVCEAKGLRYGLQNVREQAERYVKELGLHACRKILLTQGGRFYLYRRNADGSWPEEPSGYLNVERIRTNHIAPANTNAVETLIALTPAGIHRG